MLSGCKLNGTDTGNPIVDDSSGTQCGKLVAHSDYSARCVLSPSPLIQAGQVCKKLNTCFQIPKDTCFDAVVNQPELSKYITINVDTYTQLNSLLQDRKIIADSKYYDECLTALNDIECSSSPVQNSVKIDDSDPNNIKIDYSNVHSILDASISCKDIYSFKN